MSKKRKTRSQKEKTMIRREQHVGHKQENAITPISYSVEDINVTPKKTVAKEVQKNPSQVNYLKHDIRTIGLATGIVLAFDILLFTLLWTGTINFGFLGY